MEEHTRPKTVKISVWKVLTTLFAILLLVAVLTKGFTTFTASSPQKTAENTVKFINDNLLQPGMQATLVSVKEEKGLIKATISLSGNPLDIYITKDGTLLMPQVIDMTKKVPPQGTTPTATTPVAVDVANAPMQGSKNAPVTILEFSDFQCPFCGKFYKETLSQIEDAYVKTGKVKLYFRNYPLDTTCNPSMSKQLHPFACKAAEAAACADAQGKFWEYHNTLFENQDTLTIADLKKYAVDLKLDTKKFDTCLDSGEKAAEISKDIQDGSSYGVSATPTFFINGNILSGAYPFDSFKQMIDAELAKTK